MTYNEAMARLMAVEPLPVGERLARWCAPNAARVFRLPSLRRMVNRMNSRPILAADWIRDATRPLRIARERAKTERMYRIIMERQRDTVCDVHDELVRERNLLRAALEQAYEYLSDSDEREIRGIAAGTVHP